MMQSEERKIGPSGPGSVPAELKPFRALDVWEFCRLRKSFESSLVAVHAAHVFDRLPSNAQTNEGAQGAVGSDAVKPLISWRFTGHCDRDGRCAFQMSGQFTAQQECLRCGKPVFSTLEFDRLLRICKSEQEADTLETNDDEDAVAAPGKIDALQWLEDELLLCMPMFPSHEDCGSGVQAASAEADKVSEGGAVNDTHRPFEQLAGLLKGKHE